MHFIAVACGSVQPMAAFPHVRTESQQHAVVLDQNMPCGINKRTSMSGQRTVFLLMLTRVFIGKAFTATALPWAGWKWN